MDMSTCDFDGAISSQHPSRAAADGYRVNSMVELEPENLPQISGGVIPFAVALGFVWYQADNIRSCMDGFFDGAQL